MDMSFVLLLTPIFDIENIPAKLVPLEAEKKIRENLEVFLSFSKDVDEM